MVTFTAIAQGYKPEHWPQIKWIIKLNLEYICCNKTSIVLRIIVFSTKETTLIRSLIYKRVFGKPIFIKDRVIAYV